MVVILRLPFEFLAFEGVEWTLREGVAVGESGDGVDGRNAVVVQRLRQLSQFSHRVSITTYQFSADRFYYFPLTLRATRRVIEVFITNSCATPFS